MPRQPAKINKKKLWYRKQKAGTARSRTSTFALATRNCSNQGPSEIRYRTWLTDIWHHQNHSRRSFQWGQITELYKLRRAFKHCTNDSIKYLLPGSITNTGRLSQTFIPPLRRFALPVVSAPGREATDTIVF